MTGASLGEHATRKGPIHALGLDDLLIIVILASLQRGVPLPEGSPTELAEQRNRAAADDTCLVGEKSHDYREELEGQVVLVCVEGVEPAEGTRDASRHAISVHYCQLAVRAAPRSTLSMEIQVDYPCMLRATPVLLIEWRVVDEARTVLCDNRA